MIVQDTIQLSIAEQKSHDDLEAEQNVEKVKEHLAAEEIEKMVEGTENVKEDEFVNYVLNIQNDLGTRLDPGSYKKGPELRRRERGKHVKESRHTPSLTTIRSPRIHSTLISSDTEKLQELTVTDPTPSSSSPKPSFSIKPSYSLQPKTRRFKRYKSFFEQLKGRYGYLFGHLKTTFMPRKSFHELATYLQEVMQESLPSMVDSQVKEVTKTTVPVYVAEGLILERQKMQAEVAQMVADAIQRERENIQCEFTLRINNTITNQIHSQVDSSVRNYMSNYILHVHPTQASQASAQEQQYQLYLTMKDNPQLQHDDLPIWLALKIKFEGLTDSNTPCRSSDIRPRDQNDPHDDAHHEGKNSAKRQKTSKHGTYVFGESLSGQANESESSPSTSGNQEQLDDFDFWTDTHATDDDELPAEKMQNFLKNDIVWESRKEILTSPFQQKPTPVVQSCQRDHKALALSLVNQDLLYLKKGNSRSKKYVVEHWKNPHAKIFYIKRQKEPGKPKEEVYPNSKNFQVIKTTVDDYAETGLLWSLSVFIRSTMIWERVHDLQLGNNKKEKRVMAHQEIHKFCDATLKRVLKGLKSYNDDVKHCYVTPSLSKEDDEYLRLFEEEIKERLKHRDQMRRWGMYVNERPLGSRKGTPSIIDP
ncbi:hypothetical protein Tco_0405311 [Tanacetum coccineum]